MTQRTSSHTTGESAPTWAVGDLLVHRIDEIGASPADRPLAAARRHPRRRAPHSLAPAALRRARTACCASPATASPSTVHGLRVLVDTGIGNGKTRANPAWHELDTDYLQRLTAAGFPPESVDLVILTHLHTDHVGWNTRAKTGGDTGCPPSPTPAI